MQTPLPQVNQGFTLLATEPQALSSAKKKAVFSYAVGNRTVDTLFFACVGKLTNNTYVMMPIFRHAHFKWSGSLFCFYFYLDCVCAS